MSCSIPVRGSLILLLGALWLTRRADASPDTLLVVRVDTTQRRALLHLPPAASAGRPVPLVIAFHGAQGTGVGLRNGTGFNDAADLRDVLVAYPDAPLGNWARGLRLQ
jgi:poly(3-hydroxybutyrate) depolymerase